MNSETWGMLLVDIVDELSQFAKDHPRARIFGYEGEGGTWVVVTCEDASGQFLSYNADGTTDHRTVERLKK